MSPSSVQGCMKRVVAKLKLTKTVSPHSLRHSVANHLHGAGVPLRWIQKFLGHSNLQTTLIYLHLTDDAQLDGRQKLNEIAQPEDWFPTTISGRRKIPMANPNAVAIAKANPETKTNPGKPDAFSRSSAAATRGRLPGSVFHADAT